MEPLIGALLAGGTGSRLGGDKAVADLNGRPLAAYALDALRLHTDRQVFVARADTVLPDLGIETWVEPDSIRHPLTGIVHALRHARGPVVVLAADMPLITGEIMRAIALEPGTHIALAGGKMQPLCARYEPGALAALADFGDGDRLTRKVLALDPEIVEFEDGESFLNVNTPADLAEAARILSRRSSSWSGPAARNPRR